MNRALLRDNLLPWLCFLILLVSFVVPVGAVFAAYDYAYTIVITNNASIGYASGLSVLVSLNNSQLNQYGCIDADGLDTALYEGGTARDFMVASGRLGVFFPSFAESQSRDLTYRLSDADGQSSFPVIVGVGGNVTVVDNAAIELGSNFTLTWYGNFVASHVAPYATTNSASITSALSYNHVVTLPTATSGRLLLLVFGGLSSGGPLISWPAGWTQLAKYDGGNSVAGIAYRIADGAENATVNVTTTVTSRSAHQVYEIAGFTGIPQVSARAGATSANPDSPALNVTWGAGDTTLYLSCFGGSSSSNITSTPDGYGFGNVTGVSGYASSGIAYNGTVSGPSEDPGAWALSSSVSWSAWTVGIRGSDSSLVLLKDGAASAWAFDAHFSFAIKGGASVSVATNSSKYKYEVYADGTNIYLEVDDSVEDSAALGGVGVANNASTWVMVGGAAACLDYLKLAVNGTQQLWFEPNTMVTGAVLTDRQGGDHNGSINWGTNPDGVSASVGALVSTASVVSSVEANESVPNLLDSPPTFEPLPDVEDAALTGMPMYVAVAGFSDSIGASTYVGYVLLIWLTSVALGVGGLVAIGSGWGFVGGYMVPQVIAFGTPVRLAFFIITGAFLLIMGLWLWRSH